uniref:Uncharacterized protein n=1 Tax=Rhipicephalus microplus TaxID=6941 RepID=A0A6G5A000_RHIMP
MLTCSLNRQKTMNLNALRYYFTISKSLLAIGSLTSAGAVVRAASKVCSIHGLSESTIETHNLQLVLEGCVLMVSPFPLNSE